MALIKRGELGLWTLSGSKHPGKTLEEVARLDPGYLTWIWNEPKVYDFLPDDAEAALQDVMTKFGVPFEKQKRRSVS